MKILSDAGVDEDALIPAINVENLDESIKYVSGRTVEVYQQLRRDLFEDDDVALVWALVPLMGDRKYPRGVVQKIKDIVDVYDVKQVLELFGRGIKPINGVHQIITSDVDDELLRSLLAS